MQPTDYKDILLEKYEAMRAKKPALSLRQFALAIGITPSNLSDIFKGRCGLSPKNAAKVADGLGMDESEARYFLDLVESKHARSRPDREAAQKRLEERSQHPLGSPVKGEAVHAITKWYYMAALELITLTDGKIDAVDLSKRLSITIDEAKTAFSTLRKLGLIKLVSGRFVREKEHLLVESPTPSALVRKYHEQILALGQNAVMEKPMTERKLSSTLMTFDSRRYEEVTQFLSEMDNEFYRRFEAKTTGDSVHCFSFQFFRVDEKAGASIEVDS